MTALLLHLVLLAGDCGSWRQAVKVMADPAAALVRPLSLRTVEDLESIQPPPVSRDTPRLPPELHTYGVEAWLVGYRLEADGDIHLALEGDHGGHLVAEIPALRCTAGSTVAEDITDARDFFEDLQTILRQTGFRRIRVQVIGVYFADECTPQHHPIGAGRFCGELHPVTSIAIVPYRAGRRGPEVPGQPSGAGRESPGERPAPTRDGGRP